METNTPTPQPQQPIEQTPFVDVEAEIKERLFQTAKVANDQPSEPQAKGTFIEDKMKAQAEGTDNPDEWRKNHAGRHPKFCLCSRCSTIRKKKGIKEPLPNDPQQSAEPIAPQIDQLTRTVNILLTVYAVKNKLNPKDLMMTETEMQEVSKLQPPNELFSKPSWINYIICLGSIAGTKVMMARMTLEMQKAEQEAKENGTAFKTMQEIENEIQKPK